MQYEGLVESRSKVLELEAEQADALRKAGKRLASDRTWWGAAEDEEDHSDRTVIRCRPAGPDRYSVRVSNAVGVVSVPGLQLEVLPKIPASHFLFLLSASDYYPRLDEQRATLEAGQDLFELVARWFVRALERLLRRGLIKDYSEKHGFLPAKRGRIQMAQTAGAYYRGRIGFHCEYDEFNTNTPLNRVVLAASRLVVRRDELPRNLRRRARSASSRMSEVERFRPTDLRAQVSRRTAHYRDTLLLGKQLLQSEGRFLGRGQQAVWTFLIRTPDLIENGLRNLLQHALGERWKVEKRGIQATPSVSFTPDLLINDGELVGDVKYKLFGSDWNRGDLYQIVAFSTAFRSKRGFVLAFQKPGAELPPAVGVGKVQVHPVAWPAEPDLGPGEAYKQLVARMRPILAEQLSVVPIAGGGAA